MPYEERKCPDCGGTTFVEDHAAGDVVCKGCGLVVEAHIIDERSEWRTFSDKDKESADPNRVGGPSNPLLEGGGLSTAIAKGRDGDGSFALNRLQNRSNNPDKALQTAFRTLGDLAERLRLASAGVKTSACEMYKQAVESGKFKGRSNLSICAACMFMACRQNNTPRSFKEITALMPAEVRKKDISACFKELVALMKELGKNRDSAVQAALAPSALHPAEYMKRFATELRLGREMFNACKDMAMLVKPKDEDANAAVLPWDSRSPLSIAATIIYILTLIKDPVPIQYVCTVASVAEATIKLVYREMYPYLPKMLPPGFNTPEHIAKLPVPDSRGSAAAAAAAAAANGSTSKP